ncbi:recombinase family protein [Vibrio vulnificus]|nr:recombinase family protein [Vibrio vulnificus]
MSHIYQYSRISTTMQQQGSGLQRQREDTAKLITKLSKELNLPIFDKPLEDAGRSAFHGKHLENGVFGVFLAAIERNEVKSGSVLVVESLDRLSRQSPNIAQSMMLQIINKGVRIYTTIDNTMYDSSEEPAALMMKLIMSVLKFTTAHEESAKKSHRTKRNIEQSCIKYFEDNTTIVLGGKPPSWMNNDRTPKPEEIEDVKLMIALRMKGYGFKVIANKVNAKHGFIKWAPNTVSNILKSRALYGEKNVVAGNTKYTLPDYYPVLISKTDWLAMQPNHRINSTAEKNSMITGIGITKCANCGKGLVSRHYAESNLLRTMCNAKHKLKEDCSLSFNSYIAEFIVLQMCADKVWKSRSVDTRDIDEEIASTEIALLDLESNLENMASVPMMFIKKVSELEQKLEKLKSERDSMSLQTIDSNAWNNVPASLKAVVELSNDSRIELRGMIHSSIKSINAGLVNKFYTIEVVFNDNEVRRACFKGRMPNPKIYVDIKTVNDSVKLQACGIELCDHYTQLINGFDVVDKTEAFSFLK